MRSFLMTAAMSVLVVGCSTPRIVHDKSGSASTFDDLKGRAVVLTFWADYCTPCLKQLPVILDSVAAHGDRVVFLPVFAKEKPGHKLDGWIQQQPQWFQDQICWANEDFLRKYDRGTMPRTYVYGRNGKLVEKFDGMIDPDRAYLFQASLLRALAAVKD